jgi:hypothetical protein
VRRPVLADLREEGAPALRLDRDLRALLVYLAAELDELPSSPTGGLLARRQAIGSEVVSREPFQIVVGNRGEVRNGALASGGCRT